MSLWVAMFANLALAAAPAPAAATPTPQPVAPKVVPPAPIDLKAAVETRDWAKVLEALPKKTDDSLKNLVRYRALFEMERWDELETEPVPQDALFAPYFQYLKISAAHEAKQYEDVVNTTLPTDLPEPMIQSALFLKAQSLIALKRWEPAKAALREFTKKYSYSHLRSDALLELAQIEWTLDNKFEALHLYEEVYSQYPLSDSTDTATQKLREAGRFQELDAGVHLLRVNQLKRAALFAKGISELRKLHSVVAEKDRAKIDHAIAGLEFARRDYARAAKLAKDALKQKDLDADLKSDWQLLLALSSVRQGKYDDARVIYADLLKSKLSPWEKEGIHLRLGMMALDDQNFEDSQKHFKSLRTEFLKGRYQETAHWFEAWSIYQIQIRKKQKDPEYKYDSKAIEDAIELMNRLPKLPEGERLHAQALYWQIQLAELINDKATKNKALAKLENDWRASFHSILTQAKPFAFLDFNLVDITDKILDKRQPTTDMNDTSFASNSWRRVEAFSSMHLENWARLELERFRNSLGDKNQSLRNAIAYRLRDLGDWFDLVNYAKMEFTFSIEDLDPEDPVARFQYPQAYTQDVLKSAKEFEISPYVIWGVMREESRFQADVLSAAGAVGLLQLMPSVGDKIAKQLKQKPMGRKALTDPSKNIRYGAFHLRELMNRVTALKVPEEFRYPLVIASYNAGIGPVKTWIETIGTDRVDTFVESIPYTETRNYVKRVLQSSNVYFRLYGEKVRALSKSKEEKKL